MTRDDHPEWAIVWVLLAMLFWLLVGILWWLL